MAEHWRLKPEVSRVWLPAFSLSCLITSKYLYFQHEAKYIDQSWYSPISQEAESENDHPYIVSGATTHNVLYESLIYLYVQAKERENEKLVQEKVTNFCNIVLSFEAIIYEVFYNK